MSSSQITELIYTLLNPAQGSSYMAVRYGNVYSASEVDTSCYRYLLAGVLAYCNTLRGGNMYITIDFVFAYVNRALTLSVSNQF